MRNFIFYIRAYAGVICALGLGIPALQAGNIPSSGSFTAASWPWYDSSQITFAQDSFNAIISDNLTLGGGGVTLGFPPGVSPNAVANWIAYPTSGPAANSSFDINSLLYSAIGGNWATYSGRIDLELGYSNSPSDFSWRTVMSVSYVNGIAQSSVPFLRGTANDTGTPGADKLGKTNLKRLDTVGDPVQLATGAEAATRPLFSFTGARNWSFSLSYNSVLARRQQATGSSRQGFGWNHEYEIRLFTSGANLLIRRGGGSDSLFIPDAQTGGLYVSADDNSRYERITTQVGGGWLLTRRDQSSLLFNASGFLVEDRDPQGRKLVLTYLTGDTRLSRILEPISNTSLDFGYDGNNYLISLTDASGAVGSWNYYPGNIPRIRTITNQRGKQATFSYEASNLELLTLVDETTAAVLTNNTYDGNARVIAQDDGVAGNQPIVLSYEEIARPGSVIYAPSDTAKLVPLPLTAPGGLKLASIGLPNGSGINYAYDANGRLITATSGGLVTSVNYDSAGNAASVTDPAGVTTALMPRIVTTVTDRLGKQSVHTFDTNYNQLSVKDALNHTTSYTYDAANRVTSVTDPLNRTSSYTYDAQGNVLTATDSAGKVTTYTYDVRNNLLTTTLPVPAAGQSAQVTTRTYDAKNNLLTVQDALGRTTTWTYDSNSLPLTMTLPGGGIYNYTYTTGRLTSVTDPNGVVTGFGYDANGRLLYREDALAKRVTFTYDALGNVLTAKNALNQTTTYTYDHRNRVATVTEPTGAVTAYTYDNNSNVLTSTDALGKVTTYTYDGEDRLKTITTPPPASGLSPLITTYNYDEAGRLTSVVAPGNLTTNYEYDAAGQLTAVVDALGKRTETAYNSRGLLTTVTDPLSRASQFTYDDVGRRITAKDPLNRQTGLEYDALNRLKKVTDPGSLVAEQGFDLDGNRTSLKNPAANTTAFVYDAGGRLITATTPEGHATGYTYNSRGLPATVVEPSTQTTTLSYDDAQRLSSTADPVGTINLARDADGRVLTVAEGSKTLTRVYDALGRLTSYTDGDGNVIGYTYDDIGRLTKLIYPGTPPKEVNYAYDTAGRLSTVTDWANRVTTYSYNAVGQVTGTLRPNGTKQVRAYDDAGQLIQLTELAPDGTTVIYSGTHGYDAAGQLTAETLFPGIGPMAANSTQTFDADNRLLTHNGAATTFDADGNLLTVASGLLPDAYTYDARNRLSSAGGLTYGYNADNRRISVTSSAGTTSYVVNPNATLDQVLVRTTPDGTKTFYVYGLGLLHEETGSVVRYYHHDRRGDTVALTDGTGTVTDRASYGVYGELLSRTGTTNTPFLFNGKWGVQTDANGIYYHRARYYRPALRRFLNQDSILGSIDSPPALNRFAYANGNPVTGIDPFGLDTFEQNRQLNPKNNIVRDPVSSPVSHTFIYTTNQNGSLENTYSWGNTYDDKDNGVWHQNAIEDRSAAKEAIREKAAYEDAPWWKKPFMPDGGKGPKVGDSSMDDIVDRLFNERKKEPGHPWECFNNCKDEADRLIVDAKKRQKKKCE